jgi:serpin B
LDGELTEEESSAVRDHIERCPDCRKEIEAFKKVSALYRDLEDPEPPADLEERVLAEVGGIRMMRVPVRTRSSFPSFRKPLLALAATVLVVCGAAAIMALLTPTREPMKLAKTDVEDAAPAAIRLERPDELDQVAARTPVAVEPEDTRPYSKQEAARGFFEVPEVVKRGRTELEELSEDLAFSRPTKTPPVQSKEVVADLETADKRVELWQAVPDAESKEKVTTLGVEGETAKPVPEAAPLEERQVTPFFTKAEPAAAVTYYGYRDGAAAKPSEADVELDHVRRLPAQQPLEDMRFPLGAAKESAAQYETARGDVRDTTDYAVPAPQTAPAPALEDRLVVAGRAAQPSARARALTQLGLAGEQLENLEPVVRANTGFALDLYAKLRDADSNLFFSPYSISTALAMTYGGAEGSTASQMAGALHFGLGREQLHSGFAELEAKLDEVQKKGDIQLYVANSLWPQKDYPFRGEYLSLMKTRYGVSITPVDYVKAYEEARRIINKWVEERTNEKIKDIIRPNDLDPATVLVLVNAIYFKGDWASQFSEDQTHTAEFTLPGGEKKNVAMMEQEGRFGYREMEDAQVLELPYVGEQLSMFIVLPRDADGLSDIEDVLTENNLRSWISQLPRTTVRVYLPRFKVTWGTFELNESLQALGMRDAFVSGRADFSGMDGTKRLFIGRVLHKASIEVNEKGAEAAAATAVVTMRAPARTPTFRADHPFLLLICDNSTGSILFLGRIVDPSVELQEEDVR